ncbi:MAG: MBL fold metallo-hydrolase [Mizugakiibacter sp.]|uniref:MBL fold metallo-hydrolase n=1 Tax=Mizugakiibacter sp. TaxID=1972610 RepID=UPI0031C97F40|nr:MBL fold metallo-hydrolase [Xanthomonadaceae bacterium]
MRVEFHGAAGGEVTGSCHLVHANGKRVLLDCGMIQGEPDEDHRNRAPFSFDVGAIDAVVLSHAHIDHLGRLPLLVKRGYAGPIYVHEATAALAPVMLEDSASLAAHDAEWARHHGQPHAEPLYDLDDVRHALHLLRPLPYAAAREILPGVRLTLQDAGHILGSSIVELAADEGGRTRKLVYSGDLGMRGAPIMRDPTRIAQADLVLMEATYGDRNHRSRAETVAELGEVFRHARAGGGNVLIPAFAVGRTQELLYWFARYYEEWGLAQFHIFLDSPMAAKVIGVYERFDTLFDEAAKRLWSGKLKPFRLPNLHLTVDTAQSKAINRVSSGAIIIAGSGMCNGGRIRHHLFYNLGKRNAHVIFVGYQAAGTLGRRLVDGAETVHLFGEEIRVEAMRHTIGGLSAHIDQAGLLDWYGGFDGRPALCLVHGENPARNALAEKLRERYGITPALSQPGMTLEV